jgi:hypothetical protein
LSEIASEEGKWVHCTKPRMLNKSKYYSDNAGKEKPFHDKKIQVLTESLSILWEHQIFHHKTVKILTAVPHLIQTETITTSFHTTHMLGVRKVPMNKSRGYYCSIQAYCFRCNGTVYTDHA